MLNILFTSWCLITLRKLTFKLLSDLRHDLLLYKLCISQFWLMTQTVSLGENLDFLHDDTLYVFLQRTDTQTFVAPFFWEG